MTILFILFALSLHAQERLDPVHIHPERPLWGEPSAVVPVIEGAAGTLEESLRYTPGLTVTRAGGPGQPSTVLIRGAASEHTLVLLDGVAVNDIGTPAGGFDFSSLDSEMIERIEIYKGPQALRFGSGAMGGVINIVSKKGRGPFGANIHARAGSFQTNQLDAAAAGQTERWNYALSAARFESAGVSASSGGSEVDGHARESYAARLGRRWGKTEVTLISRYLHARSDLDFAPSSYTPYVVLDDPNYRSDSRFLTHAVQTSTDWRPGLQSRFSLARHDLGLLFLDQADAANSSAFREKRSAATTQFENVNTWNLGDSEFTFGPSHRRERTTREMSITGFFLNLNHRRGPIFVNLGERYDRHSSFGDFFSHQIAPGLRFREWGTEVKARFATAFKSPSLFQLYAPTFGNPDLRPERLRGFDFGFNQALGERHTLAVTAFTYESRDLVQFATRYENITRSFARGVEWEYSGEITSALHVEAGYAYTEARRRDTEAALLRRPFHAWNAGGQWRWASAWTLRVRYQGRGSRADIDPISAAAVNGRGYDTLNAAVDYRWRPGTMLTFSAENALDRNYQEIVGYGAPGRGLYLDLRTEL